MIALLTYILVGGVLMDAATVTQIISNVGFPIACCIYLLYNQERLRKTIEDNTRVIESIKTMLDIYVGKGGKEK